MPAGDTAAGLASSLRPAAQLVDTSSTPMDEKAPPTEGDDRRSEPWITARAQLDINLQPLPNLPPRVDINDVPEDADEEQIRSLRSAIADAEGVEMGTRALGREPRAVLYCSLGAAFSMSDEAAASLYSCYVALIQWANRQEPPAVLVCPDWCKYRGTDIFQRAVEYVGFRGPFVNVIPAGSAIFEPGPADEAERNAWRSRQTWVCREADQERVPMADLQDWQQATSKNTLRDGATHAITVRGLIAETNCCQALVAARLVRVLGRGEGTTTTKPCLAFVSDGGRSCLAQLAPIARAGIPLLLFAGSGRLADVLPDFYLGRFSMGMNAFKVAQLVAERTGFKDVNPAEGVRIGEILSGTLLVHEIGSSVHSLNRLLTRYGSGSDRALLDAKRRRAEYRVAAEKLRARDLALHMTYLIGSFVTTALATTHSELFSAKSDSGARVLEYVIVALPILLSIFYSIRQDLNFAPQVVALEYAAASIDREIYQYVTCACKYADAEAMRHKELDASAARTSRLCSELVRVSEVISEDSLIDSSALMRKLVPTAGKRGARVVPAAAAREQEELALVDEKLMEEQPRSIAMDTDAYVEQRVRPQQRRLERRAIVLRLRFVALKMYTYVLGAVGSILALSGLEAWVVLTTAAVATAATLNAGAPVEEQLARTRRGARRLADLLTWYGSLAVETTRLQSNMDRLAQTAENAILATMLAPNTHPGEPESKPESPPTTAPDVKPPPEVAAAPAAAPAAAE